MDKNYDNPGDRWEGLMQVKPTDVFKKVWWPKCKGCIFAEEDIQVEGETIPGYEKGMCHIYPSKPLTYDDGSEKCPYYEDENG